MTPEIVEELSKYFLKMANKKREKDGDDDYDINPNIKINMENILDDDS